MEQVVAQWWHLKATGVALDMVHQGIQAALHPHIRMAIKMAQDKGAFVCFINLVINPNRSLNIY
jgi:hypothetical protein